MAEGPAFTSQRTAPASAALTHIRVLDLTRVRSGPTCVRQLADWGADVIKIEAPEDRAQMGGPRHGADFQNLHRNKRSMTLNLKHPEGRAAFLKLAETADVVVENFRPDVKKRLGIDYETLASHQPRHRLCLDLRLRAGRPLCRAPRLRPDRARHGRVDVDHRCAGRRADARRHSDCGSVRGAARGTGDTGGADGAAGLGPRAMGADLAVAGAGVHARFSGRAVSDGRRCARPGRQQPPHLDPDRRVRHRRRLHEHRRGRSGNLAALCRYGGSGGLEDDPRYADAPSRLKHRDTLNAEIEAITRTRATADWVAAFNEAGVPAGEINDIGQVFRDPQVQHLGIAQPVQSQERGDSHLIGQAIEMSRTPSRIAAPPPLAGQHTDDVLREIGYDADAIAALRRDRAV
jgi:hypothetical protein